jgi:hypothetical protein
MDSLGACTHLAEQLGVASRKWTGVDAFVYLCELHVVYGYMDRKRFCFGLFRSRPSGSASQMPSSDAGEAKS